MDPADATCTRIQPAPDRRICEHDGSSGQARRAGQNGHVNTLDEFIDAVTIRAQEIADGSGDPPELGVQIWALALETHGPEVGSVSGPLWYIGGTLTDPVDWPGKEAEIPTAEPQMKRDAEEWLQYLDRPMALMKSLDCSNKTGPITECPAPVRRVRAMSGA